MVGSNATSVLLTWTPPSSLGGTTGYRISFTGGGNSDSVDVSGGDTNSHTLTGLKSGDTYEISIVATSEHFFSDSVEWETITLIPGNLVRHRDLFLTNIVSVGQTGGEKNQMSTGNGNGNENTGNGGGGNVGAVVAGVLIPIIILAIVAVVLLVIFLLWRRK